MRGWRNHHALPIPTVGHFHHGSGFRCPPSAGEGLLSQAAAGSTHRVVRQAVEGVVPDLEEDAGEDELPGQRGGRGQGHIEGAPAALPDREDDEHLRHLAQPVQVDLTRGRLRTSRAVYEGPAQGRLETGKEVHQTGWRRNPPQLSAFEREGNQGLSADVLHLVKRTYPRPRARSTSSATRKAQPLTLTPTPKPSPNPNPNPLGGSWRTHPYLTGSRALGLLDLISVEVGDLGDQVEEEAAQQEGRLVDGSTGELCCGRRECQKCGG